MLSTGLLAVLVLFIGQLFNSASKLTTDAGKHIDADFQARQLFGRMGMDFAQMIRRPDVDAYVKGLDAQTGNDKIAFFSQVPGYYPATSKQSPISIVAYRINTNSSSAGFNKMERLGKGLLWNGASADRPMTFGITPTLQNDWPTAADSAATDGDYETIGPQVFRFEYFYFLPDGTISATLGPNGVQDIKAISVCIAVIDPKSKGLLSDAQLGTIASQLPDYSASDAHPGDLMQRWQSTLDGISSLPRTAISAIRLYQRTFPVQSR